VTGGGRGIGAAVARALAAEGATVCVLARSAAEIERVAADVDGVALVADIADADDVRRAADAAGAVDVLVANAGVVAPLGRFVDNDIDEWARTIDVNLAGAVRIVHAVLPGMLARGWGRIVTISSGAADAPGMPSANAYSTSKAALDMFSIHLAREIEGSGVTVNAVRPGVVDSAMQDFMRSLPRDQVGDEFHERFHGLHERGELIAPAAAAAFVLEVIASEANGQVLDIRKASR
jgi:NAD(P)-dependent dehydrogenase (short-subunit alcohol dehydrogenase family)